MSAQIVLFRAILLCTFFTIVIVRTLLACALFCPVYALDLILDHLGVFDKARDEGAVSELQESKRHSYAEHICYDGCMSFQERELFVREDD